VVRRKSKITFWLVVVALVALACVKVCAQDSAIDVLRDSQRNEFLETDDDQQNWMVFWLCREMDNLRETIAANEEARREDNREMRAQLWKLALIVGGGGAIGGAGSAVVVKRRGKHGVE